MDGTVDIQECDVTESQPREPSGDPSGVRETEDPESVRLAEISSRELKAMIEALLFVSHDPLSLDRLVAALGEVSRTDVRQALHALCEDCDRQGRGLQLVERAGGFQLVTRQDYAPWIRRLDKTRSPARLSRSALETLAIIAYKQPLVRAEIEDIRRVETAGVLRTLLERKLIRIVGRKEMPGRPILYGTTKQFLEQFGLKDLSQLPPLREISELGEAEQVSLLGADGALMAGSGEGSTETLRAPLALGSEFSADTPDAFGVHVAADPER